MGGAVGMYFVNEKVQAVTERGRRAVDDLLAGAQVGVAAAGPQVAAVRERLVEHVTEEALGDLRADLRRVSTFLATVARTGEAAAGILDALETGAPDPPTADRLRKHAAELRDAGRSLAEFRIREEVGPRVRPLLERIEARLADLHRDLTTLRLEVSFIHGQVNQKIGTTLLLISWFFIWMGMGQWCLASTGRASWRLRAPPED